MNHLKIVFILTIITSLYVAYDNSPPFNDVINNSLFNDRPIKNKIIKTSKSLRAPADELADQNGEEYSYALDFSTTQNAEDPINNTEGAQTSNLRDILPSDSTKKISIVYNKIPYLIKVSVLEGFHMEKSYSIEVSSENLNCPVSYAYVIPISSIDLKENPDQFLKNFIDQEIERCNSRSSEKSTTQTRQDDRNRIDEEIDELLCVEEKGEDDYHECLRDNLEELHEKSDEDRKYKRAYNKAKGILVEHIAELAVNNQFDRAAHEDYLNPLQEVAREIGDNSLYQEVRFGGTLYNLINNSINITRIQTQLRQNYLYRYRQLAVRRLHIERRGFNLDAQRQFNDELDMLNSEFDMASQRLGLMNLDPMIYASEDNLSGNAFSIFQGQHMAIQESTEFEVLPFYGVQNPVSQLGVGARSNRSVLGPHHTLPGTSIPANGTSIYHGTNIYHGMGTRSNRSILGSQYRRVMPLNDTSLYNRGIQPNYSVRGRLGPRYRQGIRLNHTSLYNRGMQPNYSARGTLGPQYRQGMPLNGSSLYNRGMQPRIYSTRGGVNFHRPRTPLRTPLYRQGRP